MSAKLRIQRLLGWYPRSWRDRYGEEMAALLEDTYGDGVVPLRSKLALVRAGVGERLRANPSPGVVLSRSDRLRGGALLVAAGWAFFLLAGAIFAKFTDGWNVGNPSPVRWARYGYSALSWAGEAGALLVVVAALIVLPAAARLVRDQQWQNLRGPVLRAVVADVTLTLITVGGAIWAHHLSFHARNGGLASYEVFFLVWAAAAVVGIAASTTAAIAVGRRLALSERIVRVLSGVAVLLALLMVVILTGVVCWWGSEATYAPWLLRNGIGNGLPVTSGTAPPALIAAGGLMVIGLSLAGRGALRVARELPRRMSIPE